MIYSWIYLGATLFGIFYYALHPIKISIDTSQAEYWIAYILTSLIWLIPVVGLFLYSFNKRKFIIFWRLYFVFFVYSFVVMLIELYKNGEFPITLSFNAIALVGLFLYSFTKK
ncbi:MAG: hypothetical protein PHV48_04595 [Candidatus Omnitrophica bacterium]|nr:hypothetical protein [Candidatus Omnitrophota bacterium]